MGELNGLALTSGGSTWGGGRQNPPKTFGKDVVLQCLTRKRFENNCLSLKARCSHILTSMRKFSFKHSISLSQKPNNAPTIQNWFMVYKTALLHFSDYCIVVPFFFLCKSCEAFVEVSGSFQVCAFSNVLTTNGRNSIQFETFSWHSVHFGVHTDLSFCFRRIYEVTPKLKLC